MGHQKRQDTPGGQAVEPQIRNIVIACPHGIWRDDHWEGPPRKLALFYAGLLEMKIIREDWLKIAYAEGTFPQLAFGDGRTKDYRPPRWGDPERPQQLHLEIPVHDLEAAEELACGLGATRLEDRGEYRTYADPVGHPFCLYLDAEERGHDGRRSEEHTSELQSPVPISYAVFCLKKELLGMRTRVVDSPERVVIAREDGSFPMLGFQHAVFPAPRWPDSAYPQQIHLDLYCEDGKAAQEFAERLGAIRMPDMGGSCPVYSDPAAHPFCLCQPGQ